MIRRPPVWVVEHATRFWAAAPEVPSSFPRNLADILVWIPHIRVHEVPTLTIHRAAAFLKKLGIPFQVEVADRSLRGCLATFAGNGYILIDADDSEAERRFTLAHELAHFLRDYEAPRRRAAARVGPNVLEVFDGKRAPTFEERLLSLVRGVTIGCHIHLLGRDTHGKVESLAVGEAEEAADQLAFELLAPCSAVMRAALSPVRPDTLTACLISEFGLPPICATQYAKLLLASDFSQKV